jgi:hypothetical protein
LKKAGKEVHAIHTVIRVITSRYFACALVAMTAVATSVRAQDTSAPSVTLVVDETQAARRIAFVHEEISVQPGPVALAYPPDRSWG